MNNYTYKKNLCLTCLSSSSVFICRPLFSRILWLIWLASSVHFLFELPEAKLVGCRLKLNNDGTTFGFRVSLLIGQLRLLNTFKSCVKKTSLCFSSLALKRIAMSHLSCIFFIFRGNLKKLTFESESLDYKAHPKENSICFTKFSDQRMVICKEPVKIILCSFLVLILTSSRGQGHWTKNIFPEERPFFVVHRLLILIVIVILLIL